MIIQLKYRYRTKNNEVRACAKVSVSHVLTREDMAGLLIASLAPSTYEDLAELSRTHISGLIRRQLLHNREKGYFWEDNYEDEYPDEPTVDDVRQWAERQVGKL